MQCIPKLIITKPLLGIMNAILLALLFCTAPSWAGALEDLRASGAIGESYTGYVMARDSSAQAEADAINARRKTIYQEKAAVQGVSIDQVGKVYAEEIIRKVPAGTWIQINGQWEKKQ